jgi:hypothetical protein
VLGVCATAFAQGAASAEADLGGWTFERREHGITVSRRARSGSVLSAFRGEGRVKANVLQVLAVILDVRETERWAYGITSARSVRRIDERNELVYLYSDTPWPVRDRDMVVRRSVHVVEAGAEFTISIRCEQQGAQERAGVIRVHDCDSAFRIRKLDATSTQVSYEMSLDPEGAVPQWASAWVARTAPVKTLLALESRAKRNRGRYGPVIQRWASAR